MRSQPRSKSFQKFLLVWAAVATFLAIGFAVAAVVFLILNQRPRSTAELAPASRDFSTTNTVGILLGTEEAGHGLTLVETEKDGFTTITNLNGVLCRQLRPREGRDGFIYFIIDPTFKDADVTSVRVAVEYFDSSDGKFTVQYDASGRLKASNAAYTPTGKSVWMKGSNVWQTAQFYLQNCSFANAENAGGDFRIRGSPPDQLFLRRVTLTRKGKTLLSTNELPAEVDSLSPIEQRQTQNNVSANYRQELAAGEVLIGHARRFQGHSPCVAFLMSGPGVFEFSVESGIYYKYNNIPHELEDMLLQKQARLLTEKYNCSPVQFVRVASAASPQ